jgi:predicted Zn-dependent protease with MMP-like domain
MPPSRVVDTQHTPLATVMRREICCGTYTAGMQPISVKRFERLVGEALDEIPDELWERFTNVAVVIEDEHPDEPDILGLYTGIPLTERWDYGGVLPDRIVIYRLPLCRMCSDDEELVEEIRITVVHELAHHVGIDDDQLHELGWG